jgi:hypothetical protein
LYLEMHCLALGNGHTGVLVVGFGAEYHRRYSIKRGFDAKPYDAFILATIDMNRMNDFL